MSESLFVLGNGHAHVTDCFNSCYLLKSDDRCFLIDTGGGNEILVRLKKIGLTLDRLHDIFISHIHTDHFLGSIWLVRLICALMEKGEYEGCLNIYCNEEVSSALHTCLNLFLKKPYRKYVCPSENPARIIIHIVHDKESAVINGWPVTFFDTESNRSMMYGFKLTLKSGKRLCFLGDEILRDCELPYADHCDYLMLEALCTDEQVKNGFRHSKSHGTVSMTAASAKKCHAQNLIVLHADDHDILNRKSVFTNIIKKTYNGTVYVPDDYDVIMLE